MDTTTRDILWLPCDDSEIHTLDSAKMGTEDPYAIARDTIEYNDNRVSTAVMLSTPFKNIAMFINEDAALMGEPLNRHASYRLYPAPIRGHAVLMAVRHIDDNLIVGHLPIGVTRKLKSLLEGS